MALQGSCDLVSSVKVEICISSTLDVTRMCDIGSDDDGVVLQHKTMTLH